MSLGVARSLTIRFADGTERRQTLTVRAGQRVEF